MRGQKQTWRLHIETGGRDGTDSNQNEDCHTAWSGMVVSNNEVSCLQPFPSFGNGGCPSSFSQKHDAMSSELVMYIHVYSFASHCVCACNLITIFRVIVLRVIACHCACHCMFARDSVSVRICPGWSAQILHADVVSAELKAVPTVSKALAMLRLSGSPSNPNPMK